MATLMDQAHGFGLVEAQLDSVFTGSSLPKCQALLLQRRHHGALELLEAMPKAYRDEGVLDTLLVYVFPEWRGQMLAHYTRGAPSLVELVTPQALDHLDVALSALVPTLTTLHRKALKEAAVSDERDPERHMRARFSELLALLHASSPLGE